jgi:hypothetical protein
MRRYVRESSTAAEFNFRMNKVKRALEDFHQEIS